MGRNLRLTVAPAMHTGDEVAWVAQETALKDVIIAMKRRPMTRAGQLSEMCRMWMS